MHDGTTPVDEAYIVYLGNIGQVCFCKLMDQAGGKFHGQGP